MAVDVAAEVDDVAIAAVQKTQRKPLMEAISFKFQPATRPANA
jgi:hypothetical protein